MLPTPPLFQTAIESPSSTPIGLRRIAPGPHVSVLPQADEAER